MKRSSLFVRTVFVAFLICCMLYCIPLHVHAEGEPTVCPRCGSTNITQMGDRYYPDTVNLIDGACGYMCYDCDPNNNTWVIYDHVGYAEDPSKRIEPTCTSAGQATYTCIGYEHSIVALYGPKCEDSYYVTLPATGHTPVTDKGYPATCTKNGLTDGSHCSVCGVVLTAQTVIPATGHKTVTDAEKAATCTQDGLTEGSHCEVCNEVLKAQTTVPKKGHSWDGGTVTKEATENETGIKTFTCTVCKETKTEVLPKLVPVTPPNEDPGNNTPGNNDQPGNNPGNITPSTPDSPNQPGGNDPKDSKNNTAVYIAAGAAALAVVGGGAAAVIKKRRIKLSAPDLSRKDIFLAIGDNELSEETTKLLVSKRYLIAEKYDIDKPEELAKDTKNSEPDLIILGLDKDHDLDKLKEIIEIINKEAGSDYAFLVHPDVLTDDLKSVLDKMVEDEEIIGYAENGSKELALIKLILPIYKSELSFDDAVESVGKIADLLGIDGVARIADIYGAGKDIADTAKKDPNFVRTASIAGNIAEIFGWDSVSEITDFIDSIDEKKGYIDEEIERQKVINDYPEE